MLRARSVESLALGKRLRLGKVEIAVLQRHDIKKASVRIVRGRKPIRRANNSWTDVRPFFGRDEAGKYRTAGGINSSGPGQLLDERSRPQKLAVGSIEDIEETVSVGLQE